MGNTGISALVGLGTMVKGDAPGDGSGFVGFYFNDGNSGGFAQFPVAMAQDTWHKIRVVTNSAQWLVFFDDVFLTAANEPSGGNSPVAGPPPQQVSNFCLGAVGKIDFRNIKVWTQQLPA